MRCEEADQSSGSREFYTKGAAVEKARDAKLEMMVVFENRRVDNDQSFLAGW